MSREEYRTGVSSRCAPQEAAAEASARRFWPRVAVPRASVLSGSSLTGALLSGVVGCTELDPGTDFLPLSETTVDSSLRPDDSAAGSGSTSTAGSGSAAGGSAAGGSALAAAWACLDAEPVPAESLSTVSYTVTLVDSVTNQPPAGLSVQACDDIDVTCSRPVTPTTGVSPDGRVRLSMPPGFDGFFQILSDTTVPTRLYPDGLLNSNVDGQLLELIDEASVAGLAAVAGVELREDSGLVLARAFDCNGNFTRGVQFENDAESLVYAFIDGLPIQGAVTGTDGLVVFANVPQGFTYIEGTLAETGRVMGSTSAEVLPGWVVYADVRPPP